MKAGKPTKKPKSSYGRDDNPDLREVVRGLKSLVKRIVPPAKETVNSWGVPTLVQASARLKGKTPMRGMTGERKAASA